MIFDVLSNVEKYKGIYKNLDTAIDFIATHDLNTLPMGKTVIDGDKVYANVMEADTADASQKMHEVHQSHLDIQIDLEGTEIVTTGDMNQMVLESYNAETDFGTVKCAPTASCTLGLDKFTICMAGEPHMPGISPDKKNHLKKCVFKIAL